MPDHVSTVADAGKQARAVSAVLEFCCTLDVSWPAPMLAVGEMDAVAVMTAEGALLAEIATVFALEELSG